MVFDVMIQKGERCWDEPVEIKAKVPRWVRHLLVSARTVEGLTYGDVLEQAMELWRAEHRGDGS